KEELESDGFSVVALDGSVADAVKQMEERQDADWYVANYEKLIDHSKRARQVRRALPSCLAALPWDVVILDESTKVRKPKAKVTQIALQYLSQASHRAVLTGLPNPEGPEDFVTQMMFLCGGT